MERSNQQHDDEIAFTLDCSTTIPFGAFIEGEIATETLDQFLAETGAR